VSKDFDDFQRYFKKYQQRFGLTGYSVYFAHEDLLDRFGALTTDVDTMTSKASLASDLPKEQEQFKNIKRTAKHEAIHLLLARIVALASNRYLHEGELREAEEELVYKLEELIPDE
jgi:hypothetical protein